jgi:pimeloyl-ACP methyl ester carboxylesterase
MEQLDARGLDAVSPAMPGQDASPEPSVGFGVREARAIVETVRWARSRYRTPPKVILVGLSMGGAATWLASEIDPAVDGVVTEGAYARFDEAMDRFFDRKIPYGRVLLRPVVTIASAMSGIHPSSVRPVDAAAKWSGRPALVIQGADDDLILRSHADRLAQASKGELWIVQRACHAACMEVAGEEYADRLAKFASEQVLTPRS